MKTPLHYPRSGATLLLCVFTMIAAGHTARAQMFQKTYDNPLSFDVAAQSVRQTADNGYITGGYITYWGGNTSVVLSKTDQNGVQQWSREIRTPAGPNPWVDAGLCVRELVDNGLTTGYYIVGTAKVGTTYRILVIHTDNLGNVQWRRLYWGNTGDAVAYSFEIVRDPLAPVNDHLIITGSIDNAPGQFVMKGQRLFVMRLTMAGGFTWLRRYGVAHASSQMPEENVGLDVLPLDGGGYAVTGFCSDGIINGDRVPCIVLTDANGNLVWANTYPGPTGDFGQRYGVGKAIDRTNDGGLVVTGPMQRYGTIGLDVFLLRVNITGGVVWLKTYDAVNTSGSSHFDRGYDLKVEANGSYTVTGLTTFSELGGNVDHVFLKSITPDGNTVLWQHLYTFVAAGAFGAPVVIDPTVGVSMHRCTNGGNIIASVTPGNGLYLIRTDPPGFTGGCQDVPRFIRTDQSTLPASVPQRDAPTDNAISFWEDPALSLDELSCTPPMLRQGPVIGDREIR